MPWRRKQEDGPDNFRVDLVDAGQVQRQARWRSLACNMWGALPQDMQSKYHL